MTNGLKPLPGFDWRRVKWGKPDAPRSYKCSYCGASIGEDDVPLMMWTREGYAAQFCDDCMATWWGMQTFQERVEEDR